MERFDIYKDISARTNGDIYIGVVGPVRTGKSTFITRFMEKLVIPNINNKLQKQIATDEMPQSADGKTIMTTQPKFIPANAVKIQFKNKSSANVRLVDCVGYLVDGAVGHEEDQKPRLVKTPWDNNEIPFEKAAEIGTSKVISEYSTIGVVVTTDGSFGDIPRKSYEKAEEKVINELKQLKKPFIIVLNTSTPQNEDTIILAGKLEEKYGVTVITVNVDKMSSDDISEIMEKVLLEFPMCGFNVALPKWMQALPSDNPFICEIINEVKNASCNMKKMRDFSELNNLFSESDNFESVSVNELRLGDGVTDYEIKTKDNLYYKVLSQECGESIEDDYQLISFVKTFAESKNRYAKIKEALKQAEDDGYGVV